MTHEPPITTVPPQTMTLPPPVNPKHVGTVIFQREPGGGAPTPLPPTILLRHDVQQAGMTTPDALVSMPPVQQDIIRAAASKVVDETLKCGVYFSGGSAKPEEAKTTVANVIANMVNAGATVEQIVHDNAHTAPHLRCPSAKINPKGGRE
jgi:hypothetical protein